MKQERILVCLDGSPFSEQALPVAMSVARRSGASVELAQVHTDYILMYADAMASIPFEQDAMVKDLERQHLDGLQARISAGARLSCQVALLEGPVIDALCAHAVQQKADLMILTTHGRGPLSRFWLGSVADSLIPVAPCPLLVIRPRGSEPDLRADVAFHRILIPLDGSPLAEQVLEPALELGALMKSEFCIVRVCTEEGQRAEAQAYLDGIVSRFRELSLPVATDVVVASQAAGGVLAEVERVEADLVAMATHGWRGLQRLRLGSVADKILRGGSVPLLLQGPRGTSSTAPPTGDGIQNNSSRKVSLVFLPCVDEPIRHQKQK